MSTRIIDAADDIITVEITGRISPAEPGFHGEGFPAVPIGYFETGRTPMPGPGCFPGKSGQACR